MLILLNDNFLNFLWQRENYQGKSHAFKNEKSSVIVENSKKEGMLILLNDNFLNFLWREKIIQ